MLEIKPIQKPFQSKIEVPGSKSITNRALLIAALAKGTSHLENCLESEDTKYMQTALEQVGIKIVKKDQTFSIEGGSGHFKATKKNIFLGNAGTATRFLTAALSLGEMPYTITGDKHMRVRPIKELLKGLENLGIKYSCENGCPPLQLTSGKLKGGEINIDGSISSQYLSALLMIAPYSETPMIINIKNDLCSKPYIDITTKLMSDFGVKVQNLKYKQFIIQNDKKYKGIKLKIESDFSSASYFATIAALNGSEITIQNLSMRSAQGEKSFFNVLKKMGSKVDEKNGDIIVKGGKGIKPLGEIDLNHMPDTALTIAILASMANGVSKLYNIGNLRIKETDRLAALDNEFKKIGINSKTNKDSITIFGNPDKIHGAEIETYDDHRIAMCFATLGTKIAGIKIKDPKCVQKSYPSFWKDLESIGIKTINE